MPSSNMKPENEEDRDDKKFYRTNLYVQFHYATCCRAIGQEVLGESCCGEFWHSWESYRVYHNIRESEKTFKLQKLFDDLGDKTAIVFVNTKTADVLDKFLDKTGYRVALLHVPRDTVMVATDVADVAHVMHYDMPGNIEMYTHHIRLTGKTCVATTFLTLSDTDVFIDMKHILIQSNIKAPPELARHEASKFKPGSIHDRPPRRNETPFAH